MIALANILIAHSMPMFCEGVYNYMRKVPGVGSIERSCTVDETICKLEEKEIHVIFLYYILVETGIQEFIRQIKSDYPAIKIIVLTMRCTLTYLDKITAAGINGIIHASTKGHELKLGFNAVLKGEFYCCPKITTSMTLKRTNMPGEYQLELCRKERDFFDLKKKGYQLKEIVGKMKISENTAKQYNNQIMDELHNKGFKNILDYLYKTNQYT
jgi:DNA-binding NarL/FixJ family response regulator